MFALPRLPLTSSPGPTVNLFTITTLGVVVSEALPADVNEVEKLDMAPPPVDAHAMSDPVQLTWRLVLLQTVEALKLFLLLVVETASLLPTTPALIVVFRLGARSLHVPLTHTKVAVPVLGTVKGGTVTDTETVVIEIFRTVVSLPQAKVVGAAEPEVDVMLDHEVGDDTLVQ